MPNAPTAPAGAPRVAPLSDRPTPSAPSADGLVLSALAPAPVLDAEKLVVFHLALELHVLCSGLVPSSHRIVRDQLERASLSCVLNISEGAGRRSRADKRRLYGYARGSAMETAAALEVVRVRKLAAADQCQVARSLAVRVVQMLSKLDEALA